MIRLVVGPTHSRIHGEIDDFKRASLRYALSFPIPGQFFRKSHNRHAAERKYMLTEKRLEFRTGLLHKLCGVLETLDIEYEIEDRREVGEPDHFMPLRIDNETGFRSYQLDAIQTAIAEKTGMVRVATGGGKTRIMAGIVARLERRSVILVHRLDLLHQVLAVLHDLMVYSEVIGRVGGGVYEPNLVTVATVQTICAALGLNYDRNEDDDDENPRGASAHRDSIAAMLHDAKVVIVDEAHHAPARTISDVMEKCDQATWRIGLSATDWRDDKNDMMIEAAIGKRIFDVSLSDLMDMGYLVPASVTMQRMRTDGLMPCTSDNYQTLYRHYYTDNPAFHQQTLQTNLDWLEAGRHILTLVTSVKHGVKLQALHRDMGVPCVFLSGRDTTYRRNEVLEDVRAGRLRCLIGTSIADEGLDLPILDALNLAGGGKSKVKVYQRVGRTLRPFPGKENALVMDYRCRDHDGLKEKAGSRAGVYKSERGFSFQEFK